MIDIVIIGLNESASIKLMYDSLSCYTFKRIWVLDRCTDDSEPLLKELGEFYVKTDEFNLQGRCVSFARNLGLMYTNELNDVLFLDGDRYLVSGGLGNLRNSRNDVELLLLEEDLRATSDRPYSDFYGQVHNNFFSCGVFIKRSAINKIKEFLNGELFDTRHQNHWGVEDTYLGDVCFHLGLLTDIYRECALHGKFERVYLDQEAFNIRIAIREPLNVLWRPKENEEALAAFIKEMGSKNI